MYSIQVNGGKTLNGTIKISGAKNSVLPLMACSLLTKEPMTLYNVPELSDIQTMIKLLTHLGSKIKFENNVIEIDNSTITNFDAPYEIVSQMRASFWILGPLLGKYHQADISLPGGCAIGARPIDRHLYALEQLGGKYNLTNGYVHASANNGLSGGIVNFKAITVGGTMNALMMAVLADGESTINNAAQEPEVSDLAHCLVSMGANITGIDTPVLHIKGVKELHGVKYTVVPDRIESATYAVAAAITHGRIELTNTSLNLMRAVQRVMEQMGTKFTETENGFIIDGTNSDFIATDIDTQEYPGFPTDAAAQLMSLMCISRGRSTLTENIFENRFMHVSELNRMGAKITIQHKTAVINGVEKLYGAQVMASDLRASAALVLAGLVAEGTTTVSRIYHLDRGYDHLVEKLSDCGADIKRIKTPQN